MVEVIALGAANTDLLFHVKEFPKERSEVLSKFFEASSGGSAANYLVGLARLGAKTAMIGVIGRDLFGERLYSELKTEGVGTSRVRRVETPSGVVAAVVDEKGDRRLFTFIGANEEVRDYDVTVEFLADAKHVHITSLASEEAFKAMVKAKDIAIAAGLSVSVGPGQILADKGLEKIKPLIEGIDILFLNEREAKVLSGEKDLESAIAELLKYAKILSVTRSGKGCMVRTRSEKIELPAFKVKVIDTIGSGDAFAAAFTYAFLRKKPLEECAMLG
ncbi:MAG TPA: carbohydrate kinase family protein, partial [archaeon]|nr:carbohydrate kinase family protein [archaeon]